MPKVEFEGEVTLTNEVVLLEVDKDAKTKKDLGNGKFLYFDNEVDPYKKETAVQNGIVRKLPLQTRSKEMKLKIGDMVYCHHFILEPEDSEVVMNGKSYRQIAYDDIYCVQRENGDIEMLTKWNLVEPIPKQAYKAVHIEIEQKGYERGYGILRYTNPLTEAMGAKVGDMVVYGKHGDYELLIGDKLYYRMETNDITMVIDKDLELSVSY